MPAPQLDDTELDIENDVLGSDDEDSPSETSDISRGLKDSFHGAVISGSLSTWRLFRSTFYAYKWQVVFGFVIEICFCSIVKNWTRKVESVQHHDVKDTDKQMRDKFSILEQEDEYRIADKMFVMLFVCLFMQGVSVLLWFGTLDDKRRRFPRSWASAMLVFFSLVQWVFYLWGYFFIYMEMVTVHSSPSPMIEVNEVLKTDLTDSAVHHCLSHNTSLYCRSKYTDTQVTCVEVYAEDRCTGFMDTRAGDDGRMIRCCVKERYELAPPDVQRVAPFEWSMGDTFVAMQWLGVVTMSWRVRDLPILPASAAKSGFVASAWLDLLDCVMFADNQVHPKILDPIYGIIPSGDNTGSVADTEDDTLFKAIELTWLLAFSLSVMSPVVYTMFCPINHLDHSSKSTEPRTHLKAMQEIVHCVKLLDSDRAVEMVKKAVALQADEFARESGQTSAVFSVHVAAEGSDDDDVLPEGLAKNDQDGGVSAEELDNYMELIRSVQHNGRLGKAHHFAGGSYEVEFEDGQQPEREVVPVERIHPDALGTHGDTEGCKGWFDPASAMSDYDKKAELIDSFRSLFTLEAPFLCWRLWLHWHSLGSPKTTIMVTKNALFAILDLLRILACSNEHARCLGAEPVAFLSHVLEGSQLQMIIMAPVGLMKIVNNVALSHQRGSVKEKLQMLHVRRAWLVMERRKMAKDEDPIGVASFTAEINKVEEMAAGLEKRLSEIHS